MSDIDLAEFLISGMEYDSAFDQECKYGHRVGGHAVYCHNDKSPYRKCRFGWYSGSENPDHDCLYFKKNKMVDKLEEEK